MPTVPFYQVDAFASERFRGNPAAVVLLERWLADPLLQAIAAENNLSETAFLVPAARDDADYDLRWFTPTVEVDLCGHATLASGYVVLASLADEGLEAGGRAAGGKQVRFASRSGALAVGRDGDTYTLDFPATPPEPADHRLDAVGRALGARPGQLLHAAGFWLAVFDDADTVGRLAPDMAATAALGGVGVIATAPGREVDVVSRFFAPQSGIDEDPVTGSAHCLLAPYWAARLGKDTLSARQISARGGELALRLNGARVAIGGACQLVIEGRLHV